MVIAKVTSRVTNVTPFGFVNYFVILRSKQRNDKYGSEFLYLTNFAQY